MKIHCIAAKYRPSSLWSEFSMLTKTIQTKYNVDISYPEVKTFLRKTASGYLPQKSYVFQPDDIQRFLREASDNEFLASKVSNAAFDALAIKCYNVFFSFHR